MDSDRWTGTRLNSVSFPAGGTLRLYLWPRLKAKVLGRSVMQSFVDNKQSLEQSRAPIQLRAASGLPRGNSVLYLTSVTAMCECNSRTSGLAASVLRTKSS